MNKEPKRWGGNKCTFFLCVTVVLTILIPDLMIVHKIGAGLDANHRSLTAWIIDIALLLFFCAVCGKGTSGRLTGVLIDSRNVMSLSRMQMLVWTLLFIATLIVGLMINIEANSAEPAKDIHIQWELVTLMGISITSLVGSPLILSTKKEQTPDAGSLDTMLFDLKDQPGATHDGKIATNATPADARWSDMFTGEEVGNAANVDLSRVQLFYFTVIVALVYAVMIGSELTRLTENQPFEEFPAFPQMLLALIAVSHAGYLTAKTFPHTKSADGTSADTDADGADTTPPANPSANAVG
ncbi:hypothetical protein [Caballeronia sp. LZ035]|uniref:hypothetical protein n=1 Tax=Caballeronia sp. LZ035 TaxID=3038568 RepID=UPI002861CAF5|nr:hypothetical protein [Caballeronia sp. LZ035]MDR5760985.1 hypothetical protein [Caballeronia sp. LZ035]